VRPDSTSIAIDTNLSPCFSKGTILPGLGIAFGRAAAFAQHLWDGRAVHIRIQQSDRGAGGSERQGEVASDRAFADAALAGGDRHDVLNALGEQGGRQCVSASYARRQGDANLGDAVESLQGFFGVATKTFLHGASGCGEFDRKTDLAAVDEDVFNEAEGDDVFPEIGILDHF
jgi:hypothetical protein